MKKLTSVFLFLLCAATLATEYVVVGVSGFGTRKPENAWQPSAAHDLLPTMGKIYSQHKIVHYAKTVELQEIVDEFECNEGKQQRDDLKLIVLVNSWGSGKGHKLAQMYKKQCGQLAEAFYIVDGVKKPIGPFKKKILANSCYNIYQRKGAVRGNKIKGCENINLTSECDVLGYGGVKCHIHAEWTGGQHFADHMRENYLFN
ncbi:MAG: hypothetical protein VXV96_02235 [Bdellovibrionota bacterium]|nr:hypothetical protein [Bdellovibrionota bacterium]